MFLRPDDLDPGQRGHRRLVVLDADSQFTATADLIARDAGWCFCAVTDPVALPPELLSSTLRTTLLADVRMSWPGWASDLHVLGDQGRLPRVILTTDGTMVDLLAARYAFDEAQLEVTDCLLKPISSTLLAEALDESFRRSRRGAHALASARMAS